MKVVKIFRHCQGVSTDPLQEVEIFRHCRGSQQTFQMFRRLTYGFPKNCKIAIFQAYLILGNQVRCERLLSRALSLTIGLATNAQIRNFTNTQINYTQMHECRQVQIHKCCVVVQVGTGQEETGRTDLASRAPESSTGRRLTSRPNTFLSAFPLFALDFYNFLAVFLPSVEFLVQFCPTVQEIRNA